MAYVIMTSYESKMAYVDCDILGLQHGVSPLQHPRIVTWPMSIATS